MYRLPPLYISELTPEQRVVYLESAYRKIDYALRLGTTCFANLVDLTDEEIDAMEIGGYPAYYPRRPLYDRPSAEQIAAQRAAKKNKKLLGRMQRVLQEEGPREMEAMATRVWELLGNVEDDLLQEAVAWIEQEGLLLGTATKETERVGEVAAAAAEVCCSELAAAAETEERLETERVEEKGVVVCYLLKQTELQPAATAEEPLETKRVWDTLQQAEWPPLPSPTRLSLPSPPKLQAAAKVRCSKPKQAAAAAAKPRQSRIQHLLQNPALLDALPQPRIVLQQLTLFGKPL